MRVTINGEAREFPAAINLEALLKELGIDARRVALERNLEIVPRSQYQETMVGEGDTLEIVHFIGGGDGGGDDPASTEADRDSLVVAGRTLKSRLIVGTGKYRDFEQTREAIEASGADMVTVAVRRVNIAEPGQPMLADYLDPKV